ncbi:MAG: ABC transporter substrate-binding protein [Flavobacteriales bacterium]
MRILVSLHVIFLLFSCQNTDVKPNSVQSENIEFKELNWAKNFRYSKQDSETLLQLLVAGEVKQEFVLSAEKPKHFESLTWIQTPVNSMASASCVYTKMIEVLGGLEYIKGVDQKAFYYDEKIIQYIENQNIAEFYSESTLQTEKLLELKPKAFFASGFNQNQSAYQQLKTFGIPVVFSTSYLENHPLARAEWIKFFALFIDQSSLAESYFSELETNYLALVSSSKQNTESKTILLNAPFSGQWHLPTNSSYVGQLLRDAGFVYNLDTDSEKSALPIDLESIVEHYADADLWINPGVYSSLEALKTADSRFTAFRAFQNQQIYNANKRQHTAGGNDYWEMGVLRPDWVLKDLLQIKSGKTDSLFFFSKLN